MAYSNPTGLVSVTQALSPWMDWSAVPPDVLQRAADRGTRVHDAVSQCLQGGFPLVDAEMEPYFESFLKWAGTIQSVKLSEFRFSCPTYLFTGQIDLLCTIKGDNGLTLVDFKTSQQKHPSWRLQVAAYRHLAERQGFPTIRGLSVRLSRDGSAPAVDEYPRLYHNDFATFVGCLNAYRYFHPEHQPAIDWEVIL